MFSEERPRDLSYRARNGIYFTLLSGEFEAQFETIITKLLQWIKSDYDSNLPVSNINHGGFRILDTFLSDTLSQESFKRIFEISSIKKIPIKILLANPDSQFAIARHNSLRHSVQQETQQEMNRRREIRAKIGFQKILESFLKSKKIKYDDIAIQELSYDKMAEKFNQIKSNNDSHIEIQFYTEVPSGPMLFFQDVLLSGFYCAGISSRELPWLVIIDDPNINNDMYDVFNAEFERIWELSSTNRERPSSELYNYAHSYFISYSSQDKEIADHIELLLWRKNRLVIRDERDLTSGQNLSEDIESVIGKSQTFLFLCSQSSNQSDYCRGEIDVAFEYKKLKEQQGNNGQEGIQRIVVISLDGQKPQDLRLRSYLRLQGENRTERESSIRRIIDEEERI
ncbi:hypothetical protein PCC8801_4342 [Rippkaea orientalis PCC 8801]|uniref:TIR domain-containing protein n=1 Tax=Rippkaea orientalis (strain PCC 8801 / RF-1) TaxID=41431 RepID=B7JVD1_RIPO1|nr:toll/interleukin-1 receptor domain-containing protein [Rippkaea orientalis]ACK68264.1 hypothetical protein PCC8801_4342 [Rippkaea orientalis PCC 8801]